MAAFKDLEFFEINSSTQSTRLSKIAAFDLDYTLIKTKSGKKFPRDKNDWVLLHDKIPEILKNLIKQEYYIVVFSNQGGMKSADDIDNFKSKIENIGKKLDFGLHVFASLKGGFYRKPHTGMWHEFYNKYETKVKKCDCFYCGDAAGREKDFATSDFHFALNIGIPFIVPEALYDTDDHKIKALVSVPKPERFDFTKETPNNKFPNINFKGKQKMVIMCGAMASGKSTLAKYLEVSSNQEAIVAHLDLLKTKPKMMKFCKDILTAQKSLIVDATNATAANRKEYIDLIDNRNIDVYLILINISKAESMYLNEYRVEISKGEQKRIPDVAIHKFYKSLELPDASMEGIKLIFNYKPSFSKQQELYF